MLTKSPFSIADAASIASFGKDTFALQPPGNSNWVHAARSAADARHASRAPV